MAQEHRKLIFFIVDGCSTYYLDEIPDLTGFRAVSENGVKTEYSKPIFPTLSLPNYYSMFTGLYAEEHGMFSNQIYDANWKEHFTVTTKENRDRWYEEAPEPLWVKTGRLGIRTSMYWPWFVNFETKASTGNYLHRGEDFQTFMHRYEGDKAEFGSWIDSKVSEIVELLKDPVSQFIVIYWGTLDEICHQFGPRSKEAMADLKLADATLSNLQAQLDKAGLTSTVDLLVAADHGQMESPASNHICIDQYAGPMIMSGDIESWCEGEAYLLIYPAEGKEESVYQAIQAAKIDHVTAVRNSDLPDRLRVKNARRAPPIWIFAEPGYSLVDGSNRAAKRSLGIHGYDNACEYMRGVCLGRGPGFQRQPPVMTEDPVTTRDYYSIMCNLLGIKE